MPVNTWSNFILYQKCFLITHLRGMRPQKPGLSSAEAAFYRRRAGRIITALQEVQTAVAAPVFGEGSRVFLVSKSLETHYTTQRLTQDHLENSKTPNQSLYDTSLHRKDCGRTCQRFSRLCRPNSVQKIRNLKSHCSLSHTGRSHRVILEHTHMSSSYSLTR